jgi:hypothetical protein
MVLTWAYYGYEELKIAADACSILCGKNESPFIMSHTGDSKRNLVRQTEDKLSHAKKRSTVIKTMVS